MTRTLVERLAWRARTDPARSAFHFRGVPRSFGDLWREVDRLAAALTRRGLVRGERAVVAVPNGPEFFTAFYGVQLAGGVPVPLSPGSGARRLSAMAARCGARFFLGAPSGPPGGGDAPFDELRAAGLEVVSPEDGAQAAASAPLPEIGPGDLAYIQYTSGSTGEPKGVEVRHHSLLTNLRQMIEGMEITESDVFVSWLPVYHDMGLVLMTMAPLYLGAPLFLLPTSLRHPSVWLAEIAQRRGTFTAAPDFGYRVCLRRVRDPDAYDLSSLRVALNAAEPVRARTVAEFESAFGLANVMRPAYGLAEATVGVSMCALGHRARVDERGFVSVGVPFPGLELAILSERALAPRGEIGEILVRGPANTSGYWSDPVATRALFWGDGYIRTGDLGYLDAAGELFVVGRRKNLIIQGGRNIAPREVEEAIDALPFVRASAAVGLARGGDEGEQIYALAELHRKRQGERAAYRDMAAQAVEAVRSHLGLRPGRLYLVPAGTIPRTANGKIRYPALRQSLVDGSLRSSGRLLYPEY